MSVRILLFGCSGSMGKVISNEVSSLSNYKISAGVDNRENNFDYPVYKSIKDVKEEIDVIIDFSSTESLESILNYGKEKDISLVLATTGYNQKQIEKIKEASEKISIFKTANMSFGINIVMNILEEFTPLLKDFDIEIVEKHHNKKADAPSGTALMLKNKIVESTENDYDLVYGRHGNSTKRSKNEIGIHAVRGGTISGEHSVIFAGEDEVIEINHKAQSKKLFAQGAIKAAKYIIKKEKGLYNMTNLIEDMRRK
jgi:4-hydroxy-tetrahydrodipicolinate reductase